MNNLELGIFDHFWTFQLDFWRFYRHLLGFLRIVDHFGSFHWDCCRFRGLWISLIVCDHFTGIFGCIHRCFLVIETDDAMICKWYANEGQIWRLLMNGRDGKRWNRRWKQHEELVIFHTRWLWRQLHLHIANSLHPSIYIRSHQLNQIQLLNYLFINDRIGLELNELIFSIYFEMIKVIAKSSRWKWRHHYANEHQIGPRYQVEVEGVEWVIFEVGEIPRNGGVICINWLPSLGQPAVVC